MDKLIINAAITGMVPTRKDSPFVPLSPDEIVADARRCLDAGASILYIHAREPSGEPSYRKEIYYELFTRIRELDPQVIISGSTSGRVYREFRQRSEVLEPGPDCRPDLASLTLGSMNFPTGPSINAPDMIQRLAVAMNERGVVPEWECFDLGMIDYGHYLIRKGILKPPYYCNILLGSLGTLSADAFHLAVMVRALPPGTIWSATGIGRFQFPVNAMAVTMGGHVRVGLEDALYYDAQKTRLATNAGLIDRVVRLAEAVGRSPATPAEARRMIGLPERIAVTERCDIAA
ncbi:beta-keto acid cleavage family enzyme [Thermopirellula anaerolimosa]